MCGTDNSGRPRGGALAALTPPAVPHGDPLAALCGDLTFYTPGNPTSTEATHVRLVQSAGSPQSNPDYSVVIHSSGDMTRTAAECGLLHQFALPSRTQGFMDIPLDRPLSLQVGADGIVGRRVSLRSGAAGGSPTLVAEGIVGFNFA